MSTAQDPTPSYWQYINTQYVKELLEKADKLKAEGKLDEAAAVHEYATVTHPKNVEKFGEWQEHHFSSKTVQQTFFPDGNIGVVLSNQQRIVLLPRTDAGQGTVNNYGSVEVMAGTSQPGQEGVQNQDHLRIV